MTTVGFSRTEADFGDLLWLWRLKRGLSQTAFGALLVPKAGPATVSCWERGIRRPSWKFLVQIVSITGIPVHIALGVDEGHFTHP
jgi:transcriptional regulator with XRE-family HTH domain